MAGPLIVVVQFSDEAGLCQFRETAEIACRAALVGRLVLSTLHTNAPEDVATRLIVDPEAGLKLDARIVLA